MGLLDFFKSLIQKEKTSQKITKQGKQYPYADSSTITASERHCYQPDEYYTYESYPGKAMAQPVVTFEERKRTCIPSERGLYVAEILLLEYCRKGAYPNPKMGYPGFWWFEYGIRDVGHALKSLERRGFIQMASARDSVGSLKVAELKKLLKKAKAPVSGKKAELVKRVQKVVPDELFNQAGIDCKYQLTELGKQELADNAYVPYMHSVPDKTTEGGPEEDQFNVWRINQVLGHGDKSHWMEVVNRIKKKVDKRTDQREKKFMQELKEMNPEGYRELKAQDDQLAIIEKREDQYKIDDNIDALIAFWEKLWQNGGLKFEGAYWHFRLPDLYIKVKRYGDALKFCKEIRLKKPDYRDKAEGYITKLEKKLER